MSAALKDVTAKPTARSKPRIRMQSGMAPHQSANFLNQAIRAWHVVQTDALGDLRDAEVLRAHAFDLVRNNPIVSGARQTDVTNIIGTGLKLECRIDRTFLQEHVGLTEEQADDWEAHVEGMFQDYAEDRRSVDMEGQSTLYELQLLHRMTEWTSGAAVGILTEDRRPFGLADLKVQMIDPERLCNPQRAADTRKIAHGVERNEKGFVTHYHFLEAHPHTNATDAHADKFKWRRIPAFGEVTGRPNVIHTFEKTRPGQPTGITKLAPIIAKLKQLDRWSDAELMKAVVNAFFTVFITGDEDPLALNESETAEQQSQGVRTEQGEVGLGYGNIIQVPNGGDIKMAKSEAPSDKFAPFWEAFVKLLGIGLEIPYEILTKHFQSSYTAARAALLEYWKTVLLHRQRHALSFSRSVYLAWLIEKILTGAVEAPGFFTDARLRAAWFRHFWIGPPRGLVDPVKEIESYERQHGLTVKSLGDITAEMTGLDWESTVRRIGRENRTLERERVRIRAPRSAPEPEDETEEPSRGDD